MRDVAIVGGGPSGATCAERLASAGLRVTVFDERGAWEKPCGGGLTYKAIQAYPFLLDGPEPKKLIYKVELISSRGPRVRFTLDRPIVIYSRAVLNGLLLERARYAGAEVVQARVTTLDTASERPRLRVTCGEVGDIRSPLQGNGSDGGVKSPLQRDVYDGDVNSPWQDLSADFVVVAAGARNALLPGTTPLRPQDLEQTVGYYVPQESDTIKVKFLPRFEGYLWSFPRADHLSVGICGKMAQTPTRALKQHLHRFLAEEGISTCGAQFYSHVLPSPEAPTLRERRVVGRNWALVGDAAAWVDPLTGEGLHYALRSGHLLADALVAGDAQSYLARVRAEFSADLEFATRVARRFYRGRFLGGAVAIRMMQFIQRSATFRQVMRDLFAGAQDYRSLKRRLWAQLGITLTEIAASFLHRSPETAE